MSTAGVIVIPMNGYMLVLDDPKRTPTKKEIANVKKIFADQTMEQAQALIAQTKWESRVSVRPIE